MVGGGGYGRQADGSVMHFFKYSGGIALTLCGGFGSGKTKFNDSITCLECRRIYEEEFGLDMEGLFLLVARGR